MSKNYSNPSYNKSSTTFDQESSQDFHKLSPRLGRPETSLTLDPYISNQTLSKRWKKLSQYTDRQILLDEYTESTCTVYDKNIEHFIGTVKVPVGIAGPIRVNGLHANGDYLIPLATTEAALVASYNRGAKLITEAGGASTMLLKEGITRTPVFVFQRLAQAGEFVAWLSTQVDHFKAVAETTTKHGKLVNINFNIESNQVHTIFEYHTGDASGQNMVTIATNAIYSFILKNSPIEPEEAYLESNLSGDKKPTSYPLRHVRGKKVVSEITINKFLVEKYLHTTPKDLVRFGQVSATGAMLNGGIGINAHYANALAALYIACGQDAACVAESTVGITRMELTNTGDLYASVTMPNLMVGSVGGGTSLPSQKACLDIMGLHGAGKARALAEVAAALCLAGELSIMGAFCAGHFSRAHQKLAR